MRLGVILTAALALTFTVAITAYAANRGRSPVAWGGASTLVTAIAILMASTTIQLMGTTDLVFDQYGAAWAMLTALAGPVVAIVGNGVLAQRLLSLPALRTIHGSRWAMWRVADDDDGGGPCTLSLSASGLVGTRGADPLFTIAHAQLTMLEVDGEMLLLRAADNRQLRLLVADGDPNDRDARIAEVLAIKRAIETAASGE